MTAHYYLQRKITKRLKSQTYISRCLEFYIHTHSYIKFSQTAYNETKRQNANVLIEYDEIK